MFFNKSSPNHHSDYSDVHALKKKKKSDEEENDMVIEPMACHDGNIFDIFNVGN